MEHPRDPEEEVPRVARRDEPAPPPWVGRGDVPETLWVGRPVPRRPMATPRLAVVVVIIAFLVVQVAGSVVAYATASEGELPLLLAGSVFTLILEVVGWWVVYRLITRR